MTNAEKLSGIIAKWARPALTKIMTDRLSYMPFVSNINNVLIGSGIVGRDYRIEKEISPLVDPVIDSITEPMLVSYLSKIPDNVIPSMIRSLCEHVKQKGMISLLDGFIVIEAEDISELEVMIDNSFQK